jgi:antirestriction protein ArdC
LRHAGYIASWLKVLKNDNKAIFKAAALAQKAADYIKAFDTAAAQPVAEESELIAA